MNVEEIIKFLESRPGYKREGAKRLATKVLKGKASIEDCGEALSIVNNGTKSIFNKNNVHSNKICADQFELGPDTITLKQTNDKPNLRLKSRWQSANGEWLESYKATEDEIDNTLTEEDIEKAVKKAIKNIKPVKIKNYDVGTKSLLVWTADKHIGADTSDTMFDNEYNGEVFANRMDLIADNIIDTRLDHTISTLVIADLGDATDGQDGFTASKTHRLPQNMSNKEVFETYLKVHINFLNKLVSNKVADKYEYWFNTCSNHGGSYEYTCHRALQVYIENVYPDITIKSFDQFIGHTKFNDITYILTHGKDDKNRKFGLPLYPDPKTEVFIDNYLKQNKLSLNNNIRLIKADLHQAASVPCKNINRYRNVSSVFGSSGWIMDNFGMTDPGCCYEIIDDNTNDILEGTWSLK